MEESDPYSATKSQIKRPSRANDESHQLFIEKIVSIIPVPYYWGYVIFAGITFLCASVAVFYFENSLSHILSFFVLSILVAQQPIIVIWAHRKLKLLNEYLLEIIELPESEILRWYENQIAIVFDEKRMIASGFLMDVIIHFLGLDQLGFIFQSSYSYAILYIDFFLTHFFMGVGLYPLIFTALMVFKISRLPLSIKVIFSTNLQIKGLLYSKFTICAVSIYAVWGLFYLSTPDKLSTLWRASWFSIYALLLVAYFVLPQYSIHQMIMKTKKEKLEKFSKRLMDKAEEALFSPNTANISCLRNYLDIEHQIDEKCVWPFGFYEILHIVLIVIIPFVVVLLELIFGITK